MTSHTRLTFIAFAILISLSQAASAGQEGKGAFTVKNTATGMILTAGDANIQINPNPIEPAGLKLLIETVNKLPLPETYLAKMLEWILPTGLAGRSYFKVDAGAFGPAERKALLAAYQNVYGYRLKPGQELALTAVTVGQQTFLLPEFDQVQNGETRQAALLFHEALWVLNPEWPHKRVVTLEVAIQNYLSRPAGSSKFDPIFMTYLEFLFADPALPLIAAFTTDLENGTLPFQTKEGRLSLPQLFGGRTDVVTVQGNADTYFGINDLSRARYSLYQLSQKYPRALFPMELYKRIGNMSQSRLIGVCPAARHGTQKSLAAQIASSGWIDFRQTTELDPTLDPFMESLWNEKLRTYGEKEKHWLRKPYAAAFRIHVNKWPKQCGPLVLRIELANLEAMARALFQE